MFVSKHGLKEILFSYFGGDSSLRENDGVRKCVAGVCLIDLDGICFVSFSLMAHALSLRARELVRGRNWHQWIQHSGLFARPT